MSAAAKLGALVRARREELGASLRQTARAVQRSPAWLSRVEMGHDTPGEEALERLALRLDAWDRLDEWYALAGIVPRALREEMFAHPERWSAVRAVLAGRRP